MSSADFGCWRVAELLTVNGSHTRSPAASPRRAHRMARRIAQPSLATPWRVQRLGVDREFRVGGPVCVVVVAAGREQPAPRVLTPGAVLENTGKTYLISRHTPT